MEFIDVFSFILTRIILGLLSPGSAISTCILNTFAGSLLDRVNSP